jgi:hypothetical protein
VQKAIAEVFGDRIFQTMISKSIRLEESPAHKETIFTFAPQSSGAYEYYRLCEGGDRTCLTCEGSACRTRCGCATTTTS